MAALEPTAAFETELDRVLGALELELDTAAREKLLRHEALLQRWNRKLNLTSIVDPRDVAERHFGESLFVWKHLGLTSGLTGGATVADIGSGAGFPGLPIAALTPGATVTLVEPVTKKAVFLREVSRDWGNVQALAVRAEEVEGEFDWTVMRAVRAGPILGELSRLSRQTALLVGGETAEEVVAVETFRWADPVRLPWGARRQLLVGQRST